MSLEDHDIDRLKEILSPVKNAKRRQTALKAS